MVHVVVHHTSLSRGDVGRYEAAVVGDDEAIQPRVGLAGLEDEARRDLLDEGPGGGEIGQLDELDARLLGEGLRDLPRGGVGQPDEGLAEALAGAPLGERVGDLLDGHGAAPDQDLAELLSQGSPRTQTITGLAQDARINLSERS